MTPASIAIRSITPADLPEICHIESLCFTQDCFNKRQFKYLITQAKSIHFVVLAKGKVCAYCIALIRNPSVLRIYDIATMPSMAGKGMGSILLETVEEQGRKKGFIKIILEVRDDNIQAQRFYRKHGYQAFATYDNYYQDGCMAIRMVKIL